MMKKQISVIVAGVAVLSLAVWTVGSPATEKGDQQTGSITGKISVSGVRSPENVLVYVEKAPGKFAPPKEPAAMDQKKLAFIPHVLPVVKGTTVRFLNSDPILHNVFWPKSKYGPYAGRNLGTWGKGGVRKYKFDKEGSVVLLCNVHPEMEAHIVVLQNPFFTVVGKDGIYEIKGVPAGKYTVKTWYPKPKRLRSKSADATVAAGDSTKLDFSLSRRR